MSIQATSQQAYRVRVCKSGYSTDGLNNGRAVAVDKMLILFKLVQRHGQNTHQRAVPVISLRASTAFQRCNTVAVSFNRAAGCATVVEGFAVGGVFALIEPACKLRHNVIVVDFTLAAETVEGAEHHTAVIGPGAFRLIVGAVLHHIRDGMLP